MGDVSTTLRLNDQASSVLQKVAQNAKQAASAMQNAGRDMDKAFSTSAPSAFSSAAGSALASVGGEAESLGSQIDNIFEGAETATFASQMQNGFQTARNGANEFSDAAENAGDSVGELADAAEEVGDSVGGIGDGGSGLDNVSQDAGEAGEAMNKASGQAFNLGSALKTLAAIAGAMKIAGAVKDFYSDSIQLGKDYTSTISEVAAISGATGDDLRMLQDTAREYGATTIFSASEAADALKYMSLAGWDAKQSSSALGGVLNLAAASGMELGQASDMVTDYLSAFGMQAKQSSYFADMLAYAQSNSNTTAAQLGEAYLNSAANLHSAGQDVETTTSLLEAMANQGTKGARAGTQLAAIARDITNNMEDGKIQIGDTAVAVQDAQGNFRDFTDILTDVEKATDGMGSAQKAAALSTTFTADSTKGINQILTEGMDKISGYEDALRGSSGAAQKASDIMNDNLKGDQAEMKSAFEELQLQVYEGMEGTMRDGTQYLTGTIIPDLTDWVPEVSENIAEGIGKIGKVVAPLVETVLKNPGAVATAFASIAGGLTAFSAVNKISGIMNLISAGDKLSESGGLIGGIAKLGTTLAAHPWAALAAGVTAAVIAVGAAVKKYNDLQISNSLEEHFGNVELNEEQIEGFADRVINTKWLVNIQASLGHFENADNLAKQAEEALAANDAIEWKARVGIELSEDDKSNYMSNIQSYIQSTEQELQEQTLAVKLALSFTEISLKDGTSLSSKIEEWAAADMTEASALSSKLTQVVQQALEDGIIDVNEQGAIDLLQGKIDSIMSGWKASEAQAQMDILEQEYGRLSGKDLTADTFTEIVKKLGEQRETASEALEESNTKALSAVEAMKSRGRISEDDYISVKDQISQAARNENAGMLVNSLKFEGNTLADTYGEKLNENYAQIQDNTSKFFSQANQYLKDQDYQSLFNSLELGFNQAMTGTGLFSEADQKAVSKLWDVMKPDATAMTDLVDEYRKIGQAVPQSVMDEFNNAMKIGAAAGDADAAWQVFASQMVADPANKALIQAIDNGTVAVPEELRSAIERASLETTKDPVTFDSIQAELSGMTIDDSKVQALLDQTIAGLSVESTQELDGGKVAINYEVTSAMTAQELADNFKMDVNDLLASNPGIEADTELKVGTKIQVSESGVVIDTSSVGNAVGQAQEQAQAAADATDSTINETTTVNTTMEPGTVDDSQLKTGEAVEPKDPVDQTVPVNEKYEVSSVDKSSLESATSEALAGQEAANITVPANITVTPGSVDSSQVGPAVQSNVDSAFSSALTTTGTVDVTLSKGTDNIPAVYSQVGSAIQSAFSRAYSAHATVHVTITANYSLANPSKTITFGGGGSGSATVTASLHAMGGYFDQEHLGIVAEDGPEYIIPMDGSDRSREMWADAGSMLGVMDQPIVTMPNMGENAARGSTEARSDTKDINLNINGNGRMQVQSNMSKEDIVNVLIENVKDVLMNIVEQEIITEGDGVYEY